MRKLFVKILVHISILITIQTAYATNIKRLIAETDDGVVFTVWSENTAIQLNQDMVFHYTVKNNAGKSIFLVTKRNPEICVKGDLIRVVKPYPFGNTVGSLVKLNYHELKKGGTFQGKIVVPFDKFKSKKLWSINFGFYYVLDKNGLDKEIKFYGDPQSLIGEFSQRAIPVDLGSLQISIKN